MVKYMKSIKDLFNLHTKITIYDLETHEKIYETHNMITGEGRSLIANSIFGNVTMNPEKFRIYFDNKDLITTFDTNISKIVNGGKIIFSNNDNCKSIGYFGTTEGGDLDLSTYNKYTRSNSIASSSSNEYPIKIDGIISNSDKNFIIYGIGLLYDTTPDTGSNKLIDQTELTADNTNYKMFSRAYIEPVYINPNRVYAVHYELYF